MRQKLANQTVIRPGDIARSPVDKTATLVTQPGEVFQQRGKRFGTVDKLGMARRFITPPKMRPVPETAKQLKDFTGHRSGRLVVIGLEDIPSDGHRPFDKRARWVVRCDCGAYEVRRTRALYGRNEEDMCRDCFQVANYSRRG